MSTQASCNKETKATTILKQKLWFTLLISRWWLKYITFTLNELTVWTWPLWGHNPYNHIGSKYTKTCLMIKWIKYWSMVKPCVTLSSLCEGKYAVVAYCINVILQRTSNFTNLIFMCFDLQFQEKPNIHQVLIVNKRTAPCLIFKFASTFDAVLL